MKLLYISCLSYMHEHTRTQSQGLIRSHSVSSTSPVLVNWSRQTQFLLIWPHVSPKRQAVRQGDSLQSKKEESARKLWAAFKESRKSFKEVWRNKLCLWVQEEKQDLLSHFWITGKFTNHIVVAKLYEVWYFWFIMMKNIQIILFVNLAKIRSHTTEMSEIYWGKQPWGYLAVQNIQHTCSCFVAENYRSL